MKFSSCAGLFAASTLAFGGVSALGDASKVHPSVHRQLQQKGAINILVSFKGGPQAALNRVEVPDGARAREDRVVAVVESLEQHARTVQSELLALAAKYKGAEVRADDGSTEKLLDDAASLWLTNQVWIANASPKFVQMITALDNVAAVLEDEVLPFTEPDISEEIKLEYQNGTTGGYDGSTNEIQWGVSKVRAPELWAKGITGTGIVIGSIDTGAHATHEALRASYRGEFGWYDAIAQKAAPYDDVGHGTHTIGTMAGQLGYGVAPGAKWMACKACGPEGCLGSALVKCAQWMTCPTSADGTRDCTKAPHVINNSWGGGKSLSYFSDAIDGWRKAGIIPVFSNGNGGPACGTVSSPADLNTVISVGATDKNDSVASYSSKGPAGALVKPDISAPGSLVRSALQTADNAYGFMSGTSMAAPHVAGTIALMLSQKTTLSFNDIVALLRGNNVASGLRATGANCGGISESLFPNNAYGAGRLDAVLVVQKVAPAPAPTPAPTSPPFQQRPQQQQQPYAQRPAAPRAADAAPVPAPAALTPQDVVGTAMAADAAALTGDFASSSVSFRR